MRPKKHGFRRGNLAARLWQKVLLKLQDYTLEEFQSVIRKWQIKNPAGLRRRIKE